MTATSEANEPKEIEQRWMVKSGEGEKLVATARASQLVIQGYLGNTVTVSGITSVPMFRAVNSIG